MPSPEVAAAALALEKGWALQDPLSRDLDTAFSEAVKRAVAGAWDVVESGRPVAHADFRALAMTIAIAVRAIPDDPNRTDDPYSERWRTALGRPLVMVAKETGYRGETVDQVASPKTTAEVPVLAIVALIVAGLVIAGAVAFLIWRSSEVVDNELARKAELEELVRVQAEAARMFEEHRKAEASAGHPIPWSDAELAYLKRLEETISDITRGIAPRGLTPPPDVGGLGAGAALGLLAAAGLGIYAYTKGWI